MAGDAIVPCPGGSCASPRPCPHPDRFPVVPATKGCPLARSASRHPASPHSGHARGQNPPAAHWTGHSYAPGRLHAPTGAAQQAHADAWHFRPLIHRPPQSARNSAAGCAWLHRCAPPDRAGCRTRCKQERRWKLRDLNRARRSCSALG